MSVTSPTLNIILTVQDGCYGLTLTDSTGEYPSAENGYGLPGGPTINDVTTVTIDVSYGSLNTIVEYVFTVASGTITLATVSVGGGSPEDITSALTSTDWPFTSGFDLTKAYGNTALPDFADDVYIAAYTIEGTHEVLAFLFEDFSFSASVKKTVACAAQCCIEKKFMALDPGCNCSGEATITAMYGQSLLYQSTYSADNGYTDKAISALAQAQKLCDSGCNTC